MLTYWIKYQGKRVNRWQPRETKGWLVGKESNLKEKQYMVGGEKPQETRIKNWNEWDGRWELWVGQNPIFNIK